MPRALPPAIGRRLEGPTLDLIGSVPRQILSHRRQLIADADKLNCDPFLAMRQRANASLVLLNAWTGVLFLRGVLHNWCHTDACC